MSTMMINASTESAILSMLASQQERLLTTLAEKYGFDEEEARETLGEFTSVTRKEVKPRKPKESKELPKEQPKPKGKGKSKATKDAVERDPVEEKPKKAKTGYLLFCDAARSSARSRLESQCYRHGGPDDKVLAKHVVTLLASAWKDLTPQDQDMWKQRAERIKAGEEHLLEDIEVDLDSSDEEEEE